MITRQLFFLIALLSFTTFACSSGTTTANSQIPDDEQEEEDNSGSGDDAPEPDSQESGYPDDPSSLQAADLSSSALWASLVTLRTTNGTLSLTAEPGILISDEVEYQNCANVDLDIANETTGAYTTLSLTDDCSFSTTIDAVAGDQISLTFQDRDAPDSATLVSLFSTPTPGEDVPLEEAMTEPYRLETFTNLNADTDYTLCQVAEEDAATCLLVAPDDGSCKTLTSNADGDITLYLLKGATYQLLHAPSSDGAGGVDSCTTRHISTDAELAETQSQSSSKVSRNLAHLDDYDSTQPWIWMVGNLSDVEEQVPYGIDQDRFDWATYGFDFYLRKNLENFDSADNFLYSVIEFNPAYDTPTLETTDGGINCFYDTSRLDYTQSTEEPYVIRTSGWTHEIYETFAFGQPDMTMIHTVMLKVELLVNAYGQKGVGITAPYQCDDGVNWGTDGWTYPENYNAQYALKTFAGEATLTESTKFVQWIPVYHEGTGHNGITATFHRDVDGGNVVGTIDIDFAYYVEVYLPKEFWSEAETIPSGGDTGPNT